MSNKIYPFKFLDAYTERDTEIFFGRDEEIEQIYSLIRSSDIILIYGPSGAGKTSLIQCGLAKKFRYYDWLPVQVRRNNDINQSLKNTLWNFIKDEDQGFFETVERKTKGLPPLAKLITQVYYADSRTVYLIFDQFEELFVFGTEEEANTLIDNLKQLKNYDLPVKIIFSIREEYLGYLYDFERKIPQLLKYRYRVEQVGYDKVRQILTGISNLKNSVVSFPKNEIDDLAEEIINKINKGKRTLIQLPYFQVFLDNLYYEKTKDDSRQKSLEITADDVRQFPDIQDILRNFIEDQVYDLSKTKDIEAQKLWSFLSPFATLQGTKVRQSLEQLEKHLRDFDKEQIKQLLEAFQSRRILRYDENSDTYELLHDVLAQKIAEKRSEEEVARLQAQELVKSSYAMYEKTGEYLSEKYLDRIEPYLDKLIITDKEKQFIKTSRRYRNKQKLKRRLLYATVIAIISAAAIVSLIMWMQARENLKKAIIAQARGKAKDAIQFKQQEKYNAAIAKYNELLQIYRQYPQFGFDTSAVYEDIAQCRQLDSISRLFYGYMNAADSLIQSNSLDNIKQAYEFYRKATELKYNSANAKQRLGSFEIRLKQAQERLIQQATAIIETGDKSLYKYAQARIDFLLKTDPNNPKVLTLKKQ